MNREQAENILEAYVNMVRYGVDEKACQSLREVILDMMTERTLPSITVPSAGSSKVAYMAGVSE